MSSLCWDLQNHGLWIFLFIKNCQLNSTGINFLTTAWEGIYIYFTNKNTSHPSLAIKWWVPKLSAPDFCQFYYKFKWAEQKRTCELRPWLGLVQWWCDYPVRVWHLYREQVMVTYKSYPILTGHVLRTGGYLFVVLYHM